VLLHITEITVNGGFDCASNAVAIAVSGEEVSLRGTNTGPSAAIRSRISTRRALGANHAGVSGKRRRS